MKANFIFLIKCWAFLIAANIIPCAIAYKTFIDGDSAESCLAGFMFGHVVNFGAAFVAFMAESGCIVIRKIFGV